MKKLLIFSFFMTCLVGCKTSAPPMNHDTWLQCSSKTYYKQTTKDLIAATTKLLRLADGDDFSIRYTPNGLKAERMWTNGYSAGVDYWQMSTNQTKETCKVTLQLDRKSNSIFPSEDTCGKKSMINSTAAYRLFWKRLDYLLGKSKSWYTKNDIENDIQSGIVYGDIDMLCGSITLQDINPQSLR